jgi:hypothetical protein
VKKEGKKKAGLTNKVPLVPVRDGGGGGGARRLERNRRAGVPRGRRAPRRVNLPQPAGALDQFVKVSLGVFEEGVRRVEFLQAAGLEHQDLVRVDDGLW